MTFRYADMSRRAALSAAALAAMATLTGCGGGSSAPAQGDMALGAAEGAKVTVIEYASVTCPHCAAWQEETWPGFKAKYVDTNKVRYVFRELRTPPANVAAAGFAVARCAGEDKYFDVVHELMSNLPELQGADPRSTLFRIGNGAGLSNSQIEACIKDPENLKASDERDRQALRAGVTGTPTFFVNGTQVISPGSNSGATLTDLSTAIDAELAK
ncbi:thioredoxin domain-containing protein [Brevundimonas sp. M20]|uniref:thioredoxin domain-containing protein n=1 Tax=Brevundimonas sp. M20 TaxID=2591463 RepID=UPI00114629CA|nr:thioredoxin domain-containing protein [Brevundimonas sp. M20]QDH74117.1 DsbA family protein [Brevundimonas sp. M20]